MVSSEADKDINGKAAEVGAMEAGPPGLKGAPPSSDARSPAKKKVKAAPQQDGGESDDSDAIPLAALATSPKSAKRSGKTTEKSKANSKPSVNAPSKKDDGKKRKAASRPADEAPAKKLSAKPQDAGAKTATNKAETKKPKGAAALGPIEASNPEPVLPIRVVEDCPYGPLEEPPEGTEYCDVDDLIRFYVDFKTVFKAKAREEEFKRLHPDAGSVGRVRGGKTPAQREHDAKMREFEKRERDARREYEKQEKNMERQLLVEMREQEKAMLEETKRKEREEREREKAEERERKEEERKSQIEARKQRLREEREEREAERKKEREARAAEREAERIQRREERERRRLEEQRFPIEDACLDTYDDKLVGPPGLTEIDAELLGDGYDNWSVDDVSSLMGIWEFFHQFAHVFEFDAVPTLETINLAMSLYPFAPEELKLANNAFTGEPKGRTGIVAPSVHGFDTDSQSAAEKKKRLTKEEKEKADRLQEKYGAFVEMNRLFVSMMESFVEWYSFSDEDSWISVLAPNSITWLEVFRQVVGVTDPKSHLMAALKGKTLGDLEPNLRLETVRIFVDYFYDAEPIRDAVESALQKNLSLRKDYRMETMRLAQERNAKKRKVDGKKTEPAQKSGSSEESEESEESDSEESSSSEDDSDEESESESEDSDDDEGGARSKRASKAQAKKDSKAARRSAKKQSAEEREHNHALELMEVHYRSQLLGLDRYNNRYYRFEGSPHYIFLEYSVIPTPKEESDDGNDCVDEKEASGEHVGEEGDETKQEEASGDVKEEMEEEAEDGPGGDNAAQNDNKNLPAWMKKPAMVSPYPERIQGGGGWAYILLSDIDAVLEFLDDKGIRERSLKKNLGLHLPIFKSMEDEDEVPEISNDLNDIESLKASDFLSRMETEAMGSVARRHCHRCSKLVEKGYIHCPACHVCFLESENPESKFASHVRRCEKDFSDSTFDKLTAVGPRLETVKRSLFCVEAALPNSAFYPGRWMQSQRKDWLHSLQLASTPGGLLECITNLEEAVEPEWIEGWFTSAVRESLYDSLKDNMTETALGLVISTLDSALQYDMATKTKARRKTSGRNKA